MPLITNEALEWLDRAEQAREVAGQLIDPGARNAVLELADNFDRLARAAVAPTRCVTPEERARITELQDLPIDRFAEHREATAQDQQERVKTLEAKIDELLREKQERPEVGDGRIGLVTSRR